MVKTGLFTIDELYDLVNAEHSALKMEEAGYGRSGWYDFAPEDEYNDRIKSLGKHGNKFEKDLRNTAIVVSDSFDHLGNLYQGDFDTEKEFWEERNFVQEKIMEEIAYCMNTYIR